MSKKKPRGVLIAGNWKMNRGPKEAQEFFDTLAPLYSPARHTNPELRATLFVPAVSLCTAHEASTRYSFAIGAQNAHFELKGAFTGETSGPMLKELDIHWVLVGHSERRQYFGETDQTVRQRAESLLAQGFTVVACIGETQTERSAGCTGAVLERQLQAIFPGPNSPATAYLDGRLILAYEPVWAIGTGLTATPAQAEEVHRSIRNFLVSRCSTLAASKTPILYGGSVTPENIAALLACPNVDGGLVGGASLKPETYLALLEGGRIALT